MTSLAPFRKLALGAALSCAAMTLAMRVSVGPMARAAAVYFSLLASSLPCAPAPSETAEVPSPLPSADDEPKDNAVSEKSDGGRGHRVAKAAPRKRIFVGPDLVQKATAPAARPRAQFVARSEQHPAGVAFQSAGALEGTVRTGDILVQAEGQPIASFEQLVAIVGKSYERRTKYVTGRLWRRGETYDVTVEPGW
jgi:hypothetical protein